MDGVKVRCVCGHIIPSKGSAGLASRVYGGMVSVSNVACATGGISPGNLVNSDSK